MEKQLACGECGGAVMSVDGLRLHLNYEHGLTLSKARGFKCGQDECKREFVLFDSLRRHILQAHSSRAVASPDRCDIVVGSEGEGGSVHSESDHWSDEEPNVSEKGPDGTVLGLEQVAANVILKLRSNSSVTGTILTTVFECLSTAFDALQYHLSKEVMSVVREKQLSSDTQNETEKKFSEKNPFHGLTNIQSQVAVLKSCTPFIEPVQMMLGVRTDTVKDRDSGDYLPKSVRDTFQYIPVLKVIELVLSNEAIRGAIAYEKDSRDGFMSKYRDGEHFKTHPLFNQEKDAIVIQLQLYYDDLEVVNALGPKTAIHKLGAFYFSILNLPDHINSSLGAIHLLLLCYAQDLKKYSFKEVLKPFVQDLKQLEKGVTMFLDGEECVVKGTIASVCGDGLAVHEMFGLMGPQSNVFCRLCKIRREDLLAGRTDIIDPRNRTNYERDLQQIKANPGNRRIMKETGLKEECAFNESSFFHLTDNFVFDPMHDFLEGVCPMEIKLVLNYFVNTVRRFSVEQINARIHSFDYGVLEIRNRPSPNFSKESIRNVDDHSLKQKAMQMWCLMRVFPFLVCDWVMAEDAKHTKLISLLLSIMDIVFAPRVHVGSVALLDILIVEHHELFKELFPASKMINKHHHVRHYPQCLTKMGPTLRHWCMRYEGKHHDFSRHGAVCCNFKNVPKTMARLSQIVQCKFWCTADSPLWTKLNYRGGRSTKVRDLECENDLVRDLELSASDEVVVVREATENGILFCRNLFVVLSLGLETKENYPVFGQISKIYVIHSSTLLKCHVCRRLVNCLLG